MIRTDSNSLYTGISTDVTRRFQEHLDCHLGVATKGAKYFRAHKPIAVVYREVCDNRSAALKREYEIKQMSAAAKRQLLGSE